MFWVVGIRGTNGSGKTTVARRLMDKATLVGEKKASNGTVLTVFREFVAIGSYKRVCGGCDTVKTPALCYEAIQEAAQYTNVLYEGVLVGTVFQPTVDLHEGLALVGAELRLYCLNPTFEQCVENVNTRRAVEGKEPLPKTENVLTNYKKHISSAKKFRELDWPVMWCSAEEAVDDARKYLGC